MKASDTFAFYASHGPMTDPGEANALIEPLPNEVAALTRAIQGLGIYDVVARDFYGFESSDGSPERNPFAPDRRSPCPHHPRR